MNGVGISATLTNYSLVVQKIFVGKLNNMQLKSVLMQSSRKISAVSLLQFVLRKNMRNVIGMSML